MDDRPDTQSGGPTSPVADDQHAHETRGHVQGGRSSRAQEWREPEPAGDDQPTGDRGTLPEDRRGTPAGMTGEDVDERSDIARFLGLAAFPGDKDVLQRVARENGATDDVLAALDGLPAGERFENLQAAVRALGVGTEEHRH